MDYKQGQKVYIIVPPNIGGFEAKAAFQIIQADFLFVQANMITAKVDINSPLVNQTLLHTDEANVFTNLKEAIDTAYDNYNNSHKNAVDSRPDSSTGEHNEMV